MKWIGLLILILAFVSGCSGITETGNPIPQENPPGNTDPGDGSTGGSPGSPASLTYYTSSDGKVQIGYPFGWSIEQAATGSVQIVSDTEDTIDVDISSISSSDSLQDYIDENYSSVEFVTFTNINVAESYKMKMPVAVDATHVMEEYLFRTGTTLLTLTATYGGNDAGIAAQIDTIMKSVIVK